MQKFPGIFFYQTSCGKENYSATVAPCPSGSPGDHMMASKIQTAQQGDVIVQGVKEKTVKISFISLSKLKSLFESSARETISMGIKLNISDIIFFRGWNEKLDRSDCVVSYRTQKFRVTEVYSIYITTKGIKWITHGVRTPDWDLVPWGDPRIDQIAKLDEIVLPTDEGYTAQIIRWVPIESHPPWRLL